MILHARRNLPEDACPSAMLDIEMFLVPHAANYYAGNSLPRKMTEITPWSGCTAGKAVRVLME